MSLQSSLATRLAARSKAAALCLLVSAICACSTSQPDLLDIEVVNAQDLLTVDCLLPSQVRQLGTDITYLAPRRGIRTSGAQCALRGGEYVAYDRADFASALAVWMPRAEQGDPEAQTYVGEIYEKGLGTPASYETAALWYERAAQQGYARAQTNLGYLYESGLGVERDLPRALNLYRQASGFTSADLEFVSSVEIAQRESTRIESTRLNAQVELLQERLTSDRQQLRSTLNQLTQSQQQVDKLRGMLERQREQGTDPVDPEQQTLLDQQEVELESLKAQVHRLKARIPAEKVKLSPSAPIERVEQARPLGPLINIIDPPVRLAHGTPTLAQATPDPLNLIGRVEPADSLFAFRINGQDQPFTDKGLFQFTGKAGTGHELDMLAVDDKGISTRLTLAISQQSTSQPPIEEKPALSGATRPTPLSLKGVEFGSYHALIIGNTTYDNLNTLKTAGNDAIALERVLREQYDFNTVLLLDANKKTILTALERMRATLKENDNLVIYYTGHGEQDSFSGNCYWLPIDSQPDVNENWIANSAVTAVIDTLKARHVLLIADSCYSGSLTQASVARVLPQADDALKLRWLKAITRSRVRTVLSSGGNRPVPDESINAEHSVFAGELLRLLQDNTDVLEAYSLFYQLQQRVADKAARLKLEQIPQYSPIRHSGHQAGEFLFVPRSRL